jgi:hypothetical protein
VLLHVVRWSMQEHHPAVTALLLLLLLQVVGLVGTCRQQQQQHGLPQNLALLAQAMLLALQVQGTVEAVQLAWVMLEAVQLVCRV